MQIGNDALPQQVRILDDVQHFLVVILDQGQLEAILGRVKVDGAWTRRAIETVDGFALDASEIDRVIEGADNTIITEMERKLESGRFGKQWK